MFSEIHKLLSAKNRRQFIFFCDFFNTHFLSSHFALTRIQAQNTLSVFAIFPFRFTCHAKCTHTLTNTHKKWRENDKNAEEQKKICYTTKCPFKIENSNKKKIVFFCGIIFVLTNSLQ